MEHVLINGLWIGDSLPLLAQLCITSFLRNGHPFRLFVYEEVDNIPLGTRVADASEILPAHEIFFHASGSLAHFADWFRYRLLADQGGVWTDLDVVCLKPFIPGQLPWFALHSPSEVAVGFLAFPERHDLPQLLAKYASDPTTEMPWDSAHVREQKASLRHTQSGIINLRIHNPYGSTGPTEFTKAVEHFGLMSTAAAPATIYPIPWTRWRSYFNAQIRLDAPILASAWALHLWGELLRREPDALEQLSPHSIVATLLELNGLTPPESPVPLGSTESDFIFQNGRRIYAIHPHWRDGLVLFQNGEFRRTATDCRGNWEDLHEGCIGLRWGRWTSEMLIPQSDGQPDTYRVGPWQASARGANCPVVSSI